MEAKEGFVVLHHASGIKMFENERDARAYAEEVNGSLRPAWISNDYTFWVVR